ncbi:MAG: hypothetical protein HRU41_31855 [Saprospiraceae bacterium]|nr:hypothetical protein [Saprospiraceae bacterium]
MPYALFLTWLSLLLNLSPEPNYFEYHQAINRAEEYIVKEAFDSALVELEMVLPQFEFCFAKDILLASQVNLILGDREKSKYWAKRALRSGYLLSCLQQIPVFQRNYNSADWEELASLAPGLRKEYLSSIDVNLLNEFSRRYKAEQEAKRTPHYHIVVQRNFDRIKQLLLDEKGFPGEARLGLDYRNLASGLSDCDAGNAKVVVTLLHYAHPVAEIGEGLYLEAIAKGHLHPRAFALIYTFEKQRVSVLYQKARNSDRPLPDYHFNFPFGAKSDNLDKVNSDRARFGIGKYQIDLKKEAIEIKYGLKIRFSNDI